MIIKRKDQTSVNYTVVASTYQRVCGGNKYLLPNFVDLQSNRLLGTCLWRPRLNTQFRIQDGAKGPVFESNTRQFDLGTTWSSGSLKLKGKTTLELMKKSCWNRFRSSVTLARLPLVKDWLFQLGKCHPGCMEFIMVVQMILNNYSTMLAWLSNGLKAQFF